VSAEAVGATGPQGRRRWPATGCSCGVWAGAGRGGEPVARVVAVGRLASVVGVGELVLVVAVGGLVLALGVGGLVPVVGAGRLALVVVG
jgi:hypothetical protein